MCVMLQSIASVYTAAFKPANTEGRAGKVTKMKIDARTKRHEGIVKKTKSKNDLKE